MNSDSRAFIKIDEASCQIQDVFVYEITQRIFCGLGLKDIDENHCVGNGPYKWFSQNPFRSTYFACLSMAAEMSTGALAMAHLYKRKPPVSMLVIKMDAEYFKKATGRTTFTCEDGKLIEQAIEEAIATGESKSIVARSDW